MPVLHSVAVEGFEGPLDLLLDLIEKEKLNISRLSLAQVTNQYLEILRSVSGMEPESIAEFLVVAARLILIKSQRLMPQFALTSEEERGIISLEEQLKEYQRYRDKAKLISKLWQSNSVSYSRDGYLGVAISFFPPPGISILDLGAAITNVVRSLPSMEHTREESIARVVSLEQKINEMRERIKNVVVTSFRESLVKGAKRGDVVVSFLALLELVKQKIIAAEQGKAFQDILIRKRENDDRQPEK